MSSHYLYYLYLRFLSGFRRVPGKTPLILGRDRQQGSFQSLFTRRRVALLKKCYKQLNYRGKRSRNGEFRTSFAAHPYRRSAGGVEPCLDSLSDGSFHVDVAAGRLDFQLPVQIPEQLNRALRLFFLVTQNFNVGCIHWADGCHGGAAKTLAQNRTFALSWILRHINDGRPGKAAQLPVRSGGSLFMPTAYLSFPLKADAGLGAG
jgi:hypothetical protein